MPLLGWGLLGALSFSAETPETEIWSPFTGVTGTDPSTAIATIPGTTASNPLKSPAPDLTAAWYIPQPWGHMDFAAVVRPTLEVKDGLFVDRNYVGYGGQFSGDVKPHWFGWDRDYIAWHFAAGDGVGRYIGEGSANGELGLVSNYTAALAVTAAGAANILVKPVVGWGATIGYQHRWSPTLRSNIGGGIRQEDIPGLNGAVCPVGPTGSTAAFNRNAGVGGCGLNQRLINAVANLIYSPLPFVDFGVEYMYGHRITVANQKGDENVIESRFRVRF
jgi:outer membrane DcaP-like protein